MGEQHVEIASGDELRRGFTKALLRDVRALELMLERDMIESGARRIGAEQEVVLVDRNYRPMPVSDRVLEALDDPRFTVELGRFNVEFNLDPLPFEPGCLAELEHQLTGAMSNLRLACETLGATPVLCGILPSLTKDDLSGDNLTDRPRYHQLDNVLRELRGGQPYELRINGIDELSVIHDSVMLEASNTSFQVHFQVDPDDFAQYHNIAQAITGPMLAACTNSPLLFGRRLWRETRIALFQQSVDTRAKSDHLREFMARVSFGSSWTEDSVLEIYKEDIARFKPLFPSHIDEHSLDMVERGERPKLRALCLHNGTVYRWNRACYGSLDNVAHLRIENRLLPAGPSVIDEVANAAFWFGLIRGVRDSFGDIAQHMDFDDALNDFVSAARYGLEAQLSFAGMEPTPARELLALKMLPLAHRGLEAAGFDEHEIERYLGVVERRVATGRTGSDWQLRSYARTKAQKKSQRTATLTAALIERQSTGQPVHEWELAEHDDADDWREQFRYVGQYMTTDLFTVHEDDILDLAASLMDWKHIRHVPVEDADHKLVGLVSSRAMIRHLARARHETDPKAVPVREVMTRDPLTVSTKTSTLEAISLMREHKVGCLPVVDPSRKLVGIVSEHDLIVLAQPLVARLLGEGDERPTKPT